VAKNWTIDKRDERQGLLALGLHTKRGSTSGTRVATGYEKGMMGCRGGNPSILLLRFKTARERAIR
jgi:hypothetical protein